MIVTESVSSDKNMIGSKKVSGLFFSVFDKKVITLTMRMIYTAAPSALIIGFLDIYLVYQIATLLLNMDRTILLDSKSSDYCFISSSKPIYFFCSVLNT